MSISRKGSIQFPKGTQDVQGLKESAISFATTYFQLKKKLSALLIKNASIALIQNETNVLKTELQNIQQQYNQLNQVRNLERTDLNILLFGLKVKLNDYSKEEHAWMLEKIKSKPLKLESHVALYPLMTAEEKKKHLELLREKISQCIYLPLDDYMSLYHKDLTVSILAEIIFIARMITVDWEDKYYHALFNVAELRPDLFMELGNKDKAMLFFILKTKSDKVQALAWKFLEKILSRNQSFFTKEFITHIFPIAAKHTFYHSGVLQNRAQNFIRSLIIYYPEYLLKWRVPDLVKALPKYETDIKQYAAELFSYLAKERPENMKRRYVWALINWLPTSDIRLSAMAEQAIIVAIKYSPEYFCSSQIDYLLTDKKMINNINYIHSALHIINAALDHIPKVIKEEHIKKLKHGALQEEDTTHLLNVITKKYQLFCCADKANSQNSSRMTLFANRNSTTTCDKAVYSPSQRIN